MRARQRTLACLEMIEKLKGSLRRLRSTFSNRTEDAYVARDVAKDSRAEAYASGQANAYSEAESAVRDEEQEEDKDTNVQ